jgi:serine phosphatase RsbU (regulator of sigma subunit)
LEAKFKQEKEKDQLIQQKKETEIAAEFKQQKIFRNGLIFGVLLLFIIVAIILRNYNIKKKYSNDLFAKNNEILQQKQLIEEKQHEILDSITYAKRLQYAILPPQEFISKCLPKNFILYKPKDIVAGDFYWAEKIDNLFFIAAADSTGHGVPGAMVSVVCSNALNRSVKEFKYTTPGSVLDKTRELVIETFEKSASEIKDGMDVSLLCIDIQNKKVFWSGANNPLWYIQDNQIFEIKANKQPIGKTDLVQPFTTHDIEYKENTTFFLFTDGLADQFGGPKGKKFKYKQFQELLISINDKSMPEQSLHIDKEFENWKKDLEQVDDVCVIGIKI